MTFSMTTTFSLSFILLSILVAHLTHSCISLPLMQYVDNRPYYLRQMTECKGGKVYEIQNVQDVDQCKEACIQFDCAAVNLFQLGEFEFMCEILSYVTGYVPAQGAACYIGG